MDWLPYASFAIGIIAAAGIYFQLYRTRKIRQTQLIADLTMRWDSELLAKSRERVLKLGNELGNAIRVADQANSEDLFVIMRIPNFFDSLAAMVEHGDLPEKLVLDLFGFPLGTYWKLYKDALTVDQLRGISRFQRLGNKALSKNIAT